MHDECLDARGLVLPRFRRLLPDVRVTSLRPRLQIFPEGRIQVLYARDFLGAWSILVWVHNEAGAPVLLTRCLLTEVTATTQGEKRVRPVLIGLRRGHMAFISGELGRCGALPLGLCAASQLRFTCLLEQI